MNKKNSIILFILLLSFQTGFAQKKINFNHGWKFTTITLEGGEKDRPEIGKSWQDQFTTEKVSIGDTAIGDATLPYAQEMKRLVDAKWENTDLPHSAFTYPLIVDNPEQGIAYYKKKFDVPATYKNQKLTLEFEGAMQIAWVWVNGKFVTQHLGGYLPFIIDLSDKVKYGKTNSITVKLDNRANPMVPPGKAVTSLDFLYYSGIYRDVWLHVKNPLHITDPNLIDRVAGGGVFVTYPQVSDSLAVVHVKTNVINEGKRKNTFSLVQELVDAKGQVISKVEKKANTLKKGKDNHYQQQIKVNAPHLWSPDSPYLYTLKTVVTRNGKTMEEKRTKIGIRSIEITKETGVLINGLPVPLEGSNRHQNYPWIGNALSDNAQVRDAILIKESGMNAIRLSHYPQDPAFYDACDSLGILLVNCVPGWQFYNENETFLKHTFDDIRQMIRRDRNHPSVLLWEVSLNEAYPPASYRCKEVEVAKSEWDPSGKNFYTSGDSYFTKACYDVPYGDWGGDPGDRDNKTYPDNAFLMREYGDFEFGGFKSTSRQLRGDGANAMLQQAWNIQWEHNKNRQKYPRAIGDLTWAFFDGMPGYLEGIEGWGVVDYKRIPKFSYYFFQSQQKYNDPMCYIANYWNGKDTMEKVIVYSNGDEVALFVNGKEIARQLPDMGADSPYGTDWDKGGKPFDGGNANALKSPPFTFDHVKYKPGELVAVAYKAGKRVAEDIVVTAGKEKKVLLSVDTHGIPLKADGADAVFIRATIVDKNGNPVWTANNEVTFKIEGEGKSISPKIVHAEAGIATLLLQSRNKLGKINVEATANGLDAGSIVITSSR